MRASVSREMSILIRTAASLRVRQRLGADTRANWAFYVKVPDER